MKIYCKFGKNFICFLKRHLTSSLCQLPIISIRLSVKKIIAENTTSMAKPHTELKFATKELDQTNSRESSLHFNKD